MLNNLYVKCVVLILVFTPILLCSQTKKKTKFSKESYIHFKVGCVANFTNTRLFNSLNRSGESIFTPEKSMYYNPSADVEFEHRFSKHVGFNVDFGFLQTRHNYYYSNLSQAYKNEGRILCNIPHFNISPSFYIKNTTVYFGLGLYKYYYWFNPLDVGVVSFDPNSEGLAIYSNIVISENFDLKTHRFTVTVSYFGLAKVYDSGFQLSLGIAL